MLDDLATLLSSRLFMPHGHCYLWQPGLVWLQVISNGAIALAYVAISATLAYLVWRLREDIPFRGMYLAFGAFIVLCGITHVFDVYVIWVPAYWADGFVRAITAVVSVATAAFLPRLIPHAAALARGAHAARDRGIELETAVQDLGTMYQKSRELDELKSHFFANVSHELRTPLALILGPVERLLADPALSDAQRRDLDGVLRNGRLLHRQVTDLLDAAQLEAGTLTVHYADVDLAHLVRLTASNYDAVAVEQGIALVVETPEHLSAHVDPDKLQRVVLNLLSNAFKFTPRGGRVTCRVRSGGDARVAISIGDSGPGVPAAYRDAIFERFRQLDGGATRRVGGAGLGLAIVKELVQLHRGRVTVGEAPEGGALFTAELPLAAPTGIEVAPASPQTADSPAIAHGGRLTAPASTEVAAALTRQAVADLRARVDALPSAHARGAPLVLVVEDNPEMNRFVCETLAPGARTVSAFDGQDGVDKAIELVPDLIVTDVMMPRLSGDELVRRVRAEPALARTPIVLLTARADDELRVQLLRQGAQDYVTKPFALEELRARVDNLLTLKRAQDVLIEARSAAEAARKELETFSYSVSHDLRTPLRGLDGFSQLLLDDYGDRLDAEGADYLHRIRAAARRMSDLIDGLLVLARVTRLDLASEPVDVSALAASVVDELGGAERDRAVTVAVAPGMRAHGDPRLLRLVLQNLIGNAWKFTRRTAEPRVEVGTVLRDERMLFFVRDNGAGFAMEHAQRLFAPFQRLHGEDEFPGTGIGLATVQRIVARHGGRIWAEAAPGAGATFWFTLALDADESLELPAALPDVNSASASHRQPPT